MYSIDSLLALHTASLAFLIPISSMIRNEVEVDHRTQRRLNCCAYHRLPPPYFHEAKMLLPRLFTTPAVFWAMLVLSASSILADTEIRNFHLPLPPSTRSIHPSTQILDIPLPTSPQVLNVSNSSPELWIRTPLEGYASWTARISWPASVRHYHQRG